MIALLSSMPWWLVPAAVTIASGLFLTTIKPQSEYDSGPTVARFLFAAIISLFWAGAFILRAMFF